MGDLIFIRYRKIISLLFLFSFLWVFNCLDCYAQVNPLKKIYEAATIAFKQKNYKKAIKLYEKTLELYPNLAQAYNYLGLAHKKIGTDPEEIAWLFEKAVEIDPEYTSAYDNLARVYYSLGEFDKAEKSALKAIELNPALLSAKLTLGWVYLLGESMPRKAIDYFNQVLSVQEIPYAYFGLGLAYFVARENYKTFGAITKLRELDQENLALKLEQLIKNKNYFTDIKEGEPLFAPKKPIIPLSEDTFPNPDDYNLNLKKPIEDITVRLKSEEELNESDEFDDKMTGAQRIKALQQRAYEINKPLE